MHSSPDTASVKCHELDRWRRRIGLESSTEEDPLLDRGLVLSLGLHDVEPAISVEIRQCDGERARRRLTTALSARPR